MSSVVELAEFPGYGLSRDGRTWSKWIMGSRSGKLRDEWKELNQAPSGTMGYMRISPRKNGKTYYREVHTLMAMTFCGPKPSQSHQARHIDGDHLNNRSENIKWGTRSENEQDKKISGTYQDGENNHQSILKESDIPVIEFMAANGVSHGDIAALHGVHRTTISRIVRGEGWQNGG